MIAGIFKSLSLVFAKKSFSLFISILNTVLLLYISGCASYSSKIKPSTQISEIPNKNSNSLPQKFSNLKKTNVDYQLMGYCNTYMSNIDEKPSQEIVSKKIDKNFPHAGVYLVINQNESTIFQNDKLGQKLYLVNTSADEIYAWTFDDRFLIDAEVLNENNEWTPITYIPTIVSGNNIDLAILKKNRFLEFSVPVFDGTFKTKLRYTFRNNWTGKKIISNEIETNINKEQFNKNKKGGRKNTEAQLQITEIPHRNLELLKTKSIQLEKLNINETLIGFCYANTKPLKIDEDFPQGGLYLVANQKELTIAHNNNLAFYLYLVNASTERIELDTIDKCLYIIMEVLDENNEWNSISILPWSFCGNSYYSIKLNSNEYLKFNVPIFNGSFKTKLRFVLRVNKDEEICSNEIDAIINIGQLKHEKFVDFKPNKDFTPILDADAFLKRLKKNLKILTQVKI